MTVLRSSSLLLSALCLTVASAAMAQTSSFDRERGATATSTTTGTTGDVAAPAEPAPHFVGLKAMDPSGKGAAWPSDPIPVAPTTPVSADGTTTSAVITPTGAPAAGSVPATSTVSQPAAPAAAQPSSFDRERGAGHTKPAAAARTITVPVTGGTTGSTRPQRTRSAAPAVESSVQ